MCLALWQAWLTWQLKEQDRSLAAQRSRERVEHIADLAVAQLTGTLGDWDLRVREIDTLPPQGSGKPRLPDTGTVILLTPGLVMTYPHKPLLFVPETGSHPDEISAAFEAAEQIEYRDQRYDRAIEALRPLTERAATRPEALLRMARLQRKLGDTAGALATYERLSREISLSPSGVPYALLAAGARCGILDGLGDSRQTAAEAGRMRAALLEGRWPLRNETFYFYWAEVNRFQRTVKEPPLDLTEFSTLVSSLYEQWRGAIRSGSNSGSRQIQPDSSLVVWHAQPSHLTALIMPPGWIASALKLPANTNDIHWRVSSSVSATGPEPHIIRPLSEAGLAGKLDFWSVANDSNPALNRVLWLAGVLMLLLVLTGAYAIYRGVNQELHVAQLQSDFVAAVSHEFRSPLTTLRTLTEMLTQDRISSETRRRQSYVFLQRETGRLQRLVEDLLDFGRMESGRKQYRFALHDAFALVRTAVTNFREDALVGGFQVELSLDDRPATVRADEEALGRAVRNLLENAVKYSPECRTIWVDGAVNEHHARVSVRDHGMGIDPHEQREIFQKFVRGTAAKRTGIKGTGIGLSMVRQIVEAMGGQIQLESSSGVGSTFTILLPLANSNEKPA